MRTRLAFCAFSLFLASTAAAVEPLPGVAAVAAYGGTERTARLIAGAKKEGELMIYSSLTPDDQLRLAADFKSRYGVAVRTGHTHSTGRVIAGEIPLMLGVFSHDVDRMKVKGAPVDWFVLPPAVVLPSAVAVSRRAPHPSAAALFYDYLLTEGQRFYTDVHRVPANKNYDTPVRRLVRERQAVEVVNAQEAIDDYEKWYDLYKRIIVDRSQH